MANNRNLINAFDDALERLTNGENLERILKDYPNDADYLRDLLTISEVVTQVHDEDGEADSAQERGREKLLQALDRKPKRQPRRRNWFVPLTAVATIVLILGVGVLMLSLSGGSNQEIGITRTMLGQLNSTTEAQIRETQTTSFAFAEATQIPLNMTATNEQFRITMTSAATMALGTSVHLTRAADMTQNAGVDSLELTATSIIQDAMGTLTPWDSGGMPTPIPTQGIISTSVASMAQMTATPIPFNNNEISPVQSSQTTATALGALFQQTPQIYVTTPPTGGNLQPTLVPLGTILPSATSSAPTATATSTGTAAPTATPSPAGTIPPSTRVADASLMFPTFTPTPAQVPLLMPLNAGEIDDNADWDNYLLYRRNFAEQGYPVYEFNVTGRQIIRVVDAQGFPVLGATVIVSGGDFEISHTVTNGEGKTQFFPNYPLIRDIQIFDVAVKYEDIRQSVVLDLNQQSSWEIVLPINVNRSKVKLDVLFLIDTTSSMADEIAQLQNNILHISSEVDALSGNMDVHYGLVLYRDHGNFEYVTRRYPFTSDVSEFQTALNSAEANSGDNNVDWDEALNVAFDEAVNQMDWRDTDTIKLIFLVADARPHINHPEEKYNRYDTTMLQALGRGIKVHPIASSGLEAPGEYIFRQIAQVTMGHFIFLTYDNGVAGTAGDTRPDLNVGESTGTDPENGSYTVERLDELVLRLIQDEIKNYQGDSDKQP